MRSRISALVLSSILAMTFLACSKKEQTQNQPAATSDASGSATSTQPAANPPATGQTGQPMASGQQQPAPQQTASALAPAPTPAPPPPPPPAVVPAGTRVVVRIGSAISTKTASAGDTFTGSLAKAVAVGGQVVILVGAGVTGTVVDAKSPGRFKGEGMLSIAVTAIKVDGAPMRVKTLAYTRIVKGKGERTTKAVGGGAGAGLLIGGIAGGGKGALIGGLVGAGAGTAGAGLTGNKEVEIPAESVVTFKLASPVTITLVAPNATGQTNPSQ